MTGKEVRDLGYIKWKDPWAWMEPMKGKRWENLIVREKHYYNELISQPYVQKEVRHMQKEIEDAMQYLELHPFKVGCGTIDISLTASSKFFWKWAWQKKKTPAYALDVQGNIVWYVTSDEDKNYKNLLICEDTDGTKIWTKSAVSSQIAIINNLCYFIKVEGYFNTVELCVCNAQTGRNEKVLFREADPEKDLILFKTSNRTLYLESSDPIQSQLYRIRGIELEQLYKNSLIQLPLGESIYGDDCVLTRNTRMEPWTAHGKPITNWIFPKEEIQWVNIESGHVLTIFEGSQTIWYCSPKKKPHPVFKVKIGTIDPNVWSIWENVLAETFIIKSPFQIPYAINIINNKIIKQPLPTIPHPVSFAQLDIHRFHAASKDGTRVPYVVIKEKGCNPKAQLIYVYGSYGSTTPINWPYQNWYPLLKRKWAIVFAMVRGGGDVDEAWAEAARRENRHVSVDDFEAVIRASQHVNKLDSQHTVIYGRSAGGVPIGAMVSRFPDGQLIGAAFTEAPYVDVLRTSSNPELPLTVGEYKEFGNPKTRILNFKELLSVSPVNTLPADGAPGVFVISRVGLMDRQVFAYESFKWIQKLRGINSSDDCALIHPKGKYVTFERNEAHQYSPERFPKFRAIDLAILNAWVDRKLHF